MKNAWKIGTTSVLLGYFVACAPVKFSGSAATLAACGSSGVSCAQSCSGSSCTESYSVSRTVGQTPVDILIIDDNSASMSVHQENMANAFSGFVQLLDKAGLDYRIAITTTDISNIYSQTPSGYKNSAGPFNGNGSLQDGNLITMSNGASYISAADTNRVAEFSTAIERQETLHCEQSGYKECPSDDERGIYAMNLVLDRTASTFMRPTANLAVIVLSNEDERGLSDPRSVLSSSDTELMSLYPMENYDLPATFLSKFQTAYSGKTLNVHSIVVVPGDAACLAQDSNSSSYIRAKAGYSYQSLSQSTGGVVASVCSSDYTSELKTIGQNIVSQAVSLPFSCRPTGDQFNVAISPQPSTAVTWTPNWTQMVLNINQTLPPLTTVTLTYSCTKSD